MNAFTRRRFISSAAASLSFVFIPGIGRVVAGERNLLLAGDYTGRLCFNENPLGPSPAAITAIKDAAALSHRYPDWYNTNLEQNIANYHGLKPNNICAGTGATEIIRLVADAFLNPGDEMITATPSYLQMASEAIANGSSVVYVPLDNDYIIDLNTISQAITQNTKIISLVNPNNPIATIVPRNNMQDFLNSIPDGVIVVVDEAYYHYVNSSDYESCIKYVSDGLPIIVIRTFSKVYGLAGARIGYSVASSKYTSMIASGQLFGMISNSGQAAAIAALSDNNHINNTVQLNKNAMEILEEGFQNLGLDYIQSEANFIMCNTGTDAKWVADQLALSGYQVRTGYGMPQYIRISTGTQTEMNGLVQAMANILGVEIQKPKTNTGLNSVFPNPVISECKIKITSNSSERINIIIYDLTGKKIISLLNSKMETGEHSITWDACDVHGNRLQSGIYVIQYIQGEIIQNKKVEIIK